MNRGIRYDKLTSEQQQQLEKVWAYEKVQKGIPSTEEYHRDIRGTSCSAISSTMIPSIMWLAGLITDEL